MLQLLLLAALIASVAWLVWYMTAQKPPTDAQSLIAQHRYAEAAGAPGADPLHRAEALKLLGRFDEAIEACRQSNDPAARESIALSLAHLGRDLDRARALMEEMIALHPQIQEFQALSLAYIHLRRGEREEALRIYGDNAELLETRFRDDYTDPDPLLAETVWIYAQLAGAAGDAERAAELRAKAAAWAPGSVWARFDRIEADGRPAGSRS